MKEFDLVLFLDIADLAGDGRLADCETAGSRGKAALSCYCQERPCLRRGHRFALWGMPKFHICLIAAPVRNLRGSIRPAPSARGTDLSLPVHGQDHRRVEKWKRTFRRDRRPTFTLGR